MTLPPGAPEGGSPEPVPATLPARSPPPGPRLRADEMMLADEETTRYVVGECFLHLPNADAEARIEAYSAQLAEDVATAKAEVERVKGEMEALKAQLYAKFGKTINLEDSFAEEDA